MRKILEQNNIVTVLLSFHCLNSVHLAVLKNPAYCRYTLIENWAKHIKI